MGLCLEFPAHRLEHPAIALFDIGSSSPRDRAFLVSILSFRDTRASYLLLKYYRNVLFIRLSYVGAGFIGRTHGIQKTGWNEGFKTKASALFGYHYIR